MTSFRLIICVLLALAATACSERSRPDGPDDPPDENTAYTALQNPQAVTINGYGGDAMDPFFSKDGNYLFFNNPNTAEDTNLHFAIYVNDTTFEYQGEIGGANTSFLEAVATMSEDNSFYFISSRSYAETLSSIYSGSFSDGTLSGVSPVIGLSTMSFGTISFDIEVSSDGATLYFADGLFLGSDVPETSNIFIAIQNVSQFERQSADLRILENVNTASLEYGAAISRDELELFFTRYEEGSASIYRTTRNNTTEAFEMPQLVIAADGFVESPALSPDEKTLYFHKSVNSAFRIYRLTRM